jgi:3-hydroxyisobutyrate dehydrogenase
MNVAFLGMGRMGRLMASHVLDAGHRLTVWNRTPGKADELTSRGAREAANIDEAVRDADAIVLMLFGGESVDEVLGPIAAAAPRALSSSTRRPLAPMRRGGSLLVPTSWDCATSTHPSWGRYRQRRRARLES